MLWNSSTSLGVCRRTLARLALCRLPYSICGIRHCRRPANWPVAFTFFNSAACGNYRRRNYSLNDNCCIDLSRLGASTDLARRIAHLPGWLMPCRKAAPHCRLFV